MKSIVVLFLLQFASSTHGASCNLLPPLSESVGSDLGFIMIPGAQIAGEKYAPLAEQIQKQMADKARVWVGITKVIRNYVLHQQLLGKVF